MASQETTDTSADVVLKLDSAGHALLPMSQARITLGNISTSTLYGLVNQGILPAIRLGGRTMFAVQDIAELIEKQRKDPAPARVMPWDRGAQMARQHWPRRDAVEQDAAPVSPISKKVLALKRPALKRRAGR